MSKAEENKWPLIRVKCKNFMIGRVESKNEAMYEGAEPQPITEFTFDLDNKVQRYEHNTLMELLQALPPSGKGLPPYKVLMEDGGHVEGSSLLVMPKENIVRIQIDESRVRSSYLDGWVKEMQSRMPKNGEMHFTADDERQEFLQSVTKGGWERVVPSRYSDDVVLLPTRQTPNLSDAQREDQQMLLAEAVQSPWARRTLKMREWIERQRDVEEDGKPATAIEGSMFLDDPIHRQHRQNVVHDSILMNKIGKAFKFPGR